jgi:hypothetical protein
MPYRACFAQRKFVHVHNEPLITLPHTTESIAEMMQDAGKAVAQAVQDGKRRINVEVPLPITGGTELDDWPGGIGQKYTTLRPMVAEMLRILQFSRDEIAAKNFLGYADDAIGVWESAKGVVVVVFATPEVSMTERSVCVFVRERERVCVCVCTCTVPHSYDCCCQSVYA